MSKIQVKSNSLRNRSLLLNGGQLSLMFDETGIASCPEHYRETIQREMHLRPNRLTIIEAAIGMDHVPATDSAPEVSEEPVAVLKDNEVESVVPNALHEIREEAIAESRKLKKKSVQEQEGK